jgi:hypothetical protein
MLTLTAQHLAHITYKNRKFISQCQFPHGQNRVHTRRSVIPKYHTAPLVWSALYKAWTHCSYYGKILKYHLTMHLHIVYGISTSRDSLLRLFLELPIFAAQTAGAYIQWHLLQTFPYVTTLGTFCAPHIRCGYKIMGLCALYHGNLYERRVRDR